MLDRLSTIAALFMAVSIASAGQTPAVELRSEFETEFSGSEWVVFSSGGWSTVEKGKVCFYDESGRLKESVDLRGKEVLTAPLAAERVGVLLYADRQPMTLSVVRFEMYDPNGIRTLAIDNPGFNKAILAPNGAAVCGIVGAEGLEGTVLEFRDENGRVSDTIAVDAFKSGRYSRDGSRFFYQTGDGALNVARGNGQMLYALGIADSWASSVDGQIVAIARQSTIRLFSGGAGVGELAWPAEYGSIRSVALSPDAGYGAAISADRLALFRVEPGELLWEFVNDVPGWNLRSLDISKNADWVAVGADYDPGATSTLRHAQSRCLVFNRHGELIGRRARAPKSWGAQYPMVRFIGDHQTLLFADRDGMSRLRIVPPGATEY
jgi:hypothetical protein